MKKLLSVFAIMAMASAAIGAAADVDGRPYEIVWANRTHDDHEPILPMTAAAGWRVETQNAVARLESATDRKLFGPGVVRLVYRGTGKNPRVKILPPKPVRVTNAFDAVSLWIYGNNVYYSAKAKDTPSTTLTAEFLDADGKPFSVQVAHIHHPDGRHEHGGPLARLHELLRLQGGVRACLVQGAPEAREPRVPRRPRRHQHGRRHAAVPEPRSHRRAAGERRDVPVPPAVRPRHLGRPRLQPRRRQDVAAGRAADSGSRPTTRRARRSARRVRTRP